MFARTDRRRAPRLTWRGLTVLAVGVALLAAAAYFSRRDLLIMGMVLVVLPAACVFFVTRHRPVVRVDRAVRPSVVTTGDDAMVTVQFSGDSDGFASRLAWHDRLPPRVEELGDAGWSRDGRGRVRMRHRVRAVHRGVYELGPVAVDVHDIFGFAYRRWSLGGSTSFVVVPPVTPLGDGRDAPFSAEGDEQRNVRLLGQSAEGLSAREYRPGDPLRKVHWRATARFGELMVRQEEQGASQEAWLVFDTRAASAAGARGNDGSRASGDEVFERGVRLVASLTARLIGSGHHVGIVETGRRQLAGGTGPAHGGVRPESVAGFASEPGMRAALVQLAAIDQQRGPIVEAPDEPLTSLQRSGRAAPVFAVLRVAEPAVIDMLRSVTSLASIAVLFLLEPIETGTAELLKDAGWRLVELFDDDIAGVWRRSVAGSDGAEAGAS